MLRRHPWEMHPTNFETYEEWMQAHRGRKFLVCFFVHRGFNMAQIGRALGVSNERVRQIKTRLWKEFALPCGLDTSLGGAAYERYLKKENNNANRSMEDTKREMVLDL